MPPRAVCDSSYKNLNRADEPRCILEMALSCHTRARRDIEAARSPPQDEFGEHKEAWGFKPPRVPVDDAQQGADCTLTADTLLGTILTRVGLPGLMPLPWWQTLAMFIYAMVSCLVVNDALKVLMI